MTPAETLARKDDASAASIGLRIRAIRLNAEETQNEFARRLGFQKAVVGNWETGKSSPRPTTMAAICKCHGVSADFLLIGKLDTLPENQRKALVMALESAVEELGENQAVAQARRNYRERI